jgi:hypothetical protein
MMCGRTPVSLDLGDELVGLGAELVGGPVLPGRSKGTEYHGPTSWHRDASGPSHSLGFLCYLGGADDDTGGLQVAPGSHHADYGRALDGHTSAAQPVTGTTLDPSPGDVIVMDERLFHASDARGTRRQWRVDIVVDRGLDDELARWYAGQHPPGWDGGYDPNLFPSYGIDWQSRHPVWAQRLEQLGVLDLVATEERFMRTRSGDLRSLDTVAEADTWN